MRRSMVMIAVMGWAGCTGRPVEIGGPEPTDRETGATTEDTSQPTTSAPGDMPASFSTGQFPNGIAADQDYIYVAIGEPHSGPDSLPIPPGRSGAVEVYSAADGALVKRIDVLGGGHSMRMTSDGEKLYLAHFSLDNQVTVISTGSLEVVGEIGGLLQLDIVVPDALSISPDGQWVYVGSNGLNSGWISRIDTSTDSVDRSWRADVEGGYTCWVEASPRPELLYANSWTGGTVQLKDAATGESLQSVSVGAFPHALAIDPTGERVYAMVSGGNQVLVLDALTLETEAEVDGPWFGLWGGPVSGTLAHSGRYLFVANHFLGKIGVIDIDPESPSYHTVVDSYDVGSDPIFTALSPDGTRLYVANNESATIDVLDVSSWQ